jgi:hypothetical protein
MELCFRDSVPCDRRDPGWNKSPSRRLWHVICNFFKQCTEEGSNPSFNQERLQRSFAQRFMSQPRAADNNSLYIVWFTDGAIQKKKAGLYKKVEIDFNAIPARPVQPPAIPGVAPAVVHDERFPHQVLCAGLMSPDNFFKYITPIAGGTISFLLVARSMLKIIHVLLNEVGDWPQGFTNSDFVDAVGDVEVVPGVELYKFFSSRHQLTEMMKTQRDLFGTLSNLKFVESGLTEKTKHWAVMKAVGGSGVAMLYYKAMEKWKGDPSQFPKPDVPYFSMNQDTEGRPTTFVQGGRVGSVQALFVFRERLKEAKSLGCLSIPLVHYIYERRREWIENRAAYAAGVAARKGGQELADLSRANILLCQKFSVKRLNSTGDRLAPQVPEFPVAIN